MLRREFVAQDDDGLYRLDVASAFATTHTGTGYRTGYMAPFLHTVGKRTYHTDDPGRLAAYSSFGSGYTGDTEDEDGEEQDGLDDMDPMDDPDLFLDRISKRRDFECHDALLIKLEVDENG
jgi:hypothetical protein